MKNKVTTVSVHVLAWVLLLLVPYFSTYQVLKSFSMNANQISFLPILVISTVLIVMFYINYFVFIPKYLLTKKYIRYVFTVILTLVSTLLLIRLVFGLINLNPESFENQYPAISKIGPIAKANAFLMLIVSLVTSISLALNSQLKLSEREKLSAQLSSLKSQINPHFLFNTLNSIYVTAIDKSPTTAEMVQKLSQMMRYTMKDTQNDFVPLEDELQYLQNYIDLQKVRLENSIKLSFTITGKVEEQSIAPMLMLPFIENAFKYGVNAEENSSIIIDINIDEDNLYLYISNNKVQVQTLTNESSGLGIENTRSRLHLLYPKQHNLKIDDAEKQFLVSLHIKLV